MKTLILSFTLALTGFTAFARNAHVSTAPFDTIKIQIDSNLNTYFQRVVKVDSRITVDILYTRAIQFMAAKNIIQTYGYEQEGKLIFTTSQDLNFNADYVGDENDNIQPYTAQFAIMLDIKHGIYRYTINNVVFFYPSAGGNRRETLLELYNKATNTVSKRIARSSQYMLISFERYLGKFTDDLQQGIEQKTAMYSKF